MGSILGGGKPKRDKAAEARQAAELKKLTDQENQRKLAANRKKRGRASLISGEETGLPDTLGG